MLVEFYESRARSMDCFRNMLDVSVLAAACLEYKAKDVASEETTVEVVTAESKTFSASFDLKNCASWVIAGFPGVEVDPHGLAVRGGFYECSIDRDAFSLFPGSADPQRDCCRCTPLGFSLSLARGDRWVYRAVDRCLARRVAWPFRPRSLV